MIDSFAEIVANGLEKIGANDFFTGLIIDGMIGGVGAVIGFLPLIMILFFLLTLLEDSGYMIRVSLVLDRFFQKIGLSGKSIIPMFIGTACAVPAVMSARTIKNERQRRMSILLTPFVPCGAKLPVIALFLGVFFTGSAYMTFIVYATVVIAIFITGLIIKKLTNADFSESEESYLIAELPQYKLPSFKRAFFVMLKRGKSFIINAGTIILLANTIIWFLSSFDFTLQSVEPNESILRYLSQPIAWMLIPLGFGVWGLASAAVTGFVAKEEVVGALAVIFAFAVTDAFDVSNSAAAKDALMNVGGLTAVSALAYMFFNLFTPPCFAAIGAMKTELNSRRWLVFAIILQLVIGYMFAMIIYQVGTIIAYGELGKGFVASIFILTAIVGVLAYLAKIAKQGKGLAKID